jgi:hypothetical protein
MPHEAPSAEQAWQELEELYGQGVELLKGLDRLGLYLAGAHLAMALEAMRQRHPGLPSID